MGTVTESIAPALRDVSSEEALVLLVREKLRVIVLLQLQWE